MTEFDWREEALEPHVIERDGERFAVHHGQEKRITSPAECEAKLEKLFEKAVMEAPDDAGFDHLDIKNDHYRKTYCDYWVGIAKWLGEASSDLDFFWRSQCFASLEKAWEGYFPVVAP